MKKILKGIHLLGLVVFLGSIFSFIVISILSEGSSLSDLFFGRRIIELGTKSLTIPGMYLSLISGVLLAWPDLKKEMWIKVKVLTLVIIFINAYIFIIPAADHCLQLAKEASLSGVLSPSYKIYYMKETLFGALNISLSLMAAGLGVFYSKKQKKDKI